MPSELQTAFFIFMHTAKKHQGTGIPVRTKITARISWFGFTYFSDTLAISSSAKARYALVPFACES